MMEAIWLVAAGIAAIASLAAARCDAWPVEGVAGWEGDRFSQGYGFVMFGASLPGNGAITFPLRVNASYLYYNYGDQGETVKVGGPGAGGLLGLRSTRPWGAITLLAGGEVRWERRDRLSVPSRGRAPRAAATAQAEGDFAWRRRLRPFFLLTYSGAARYVYGRAGLRWQVSNLEWRGPITWSLGLEGVGQGNADTDAVQAGATVECALVRSRLSVSIRGGYKDAASDGGRRHGGYVGAGLYRRF